jgi:hypothetical protein
MPPIDKTTELVLPESMLPGVNEKVAATEVAQASQVATQQAHDVLERILTV